MDSNTSFSYPVEYPKKDPDLMKWQLATLDLIEEIKHELRCETYDEKLSQWIKQKGVEPLVNDIGINGLVGFVSGLANKNTILSNLNEKDIYEIMIVLCDRIADHIFLNREKYAIKRDDMDMVFGKIEMFCYMSLMRAKDEGERSFLKAIERRSEIYKMGEDQKKSILPGWLGFGGGK